MAKVKRRGQVRKVRKKPARTPIKPPDLRKIGREIAKLGKREWLIQELTKAFYDARKNKVKTFNEHHYEVNWQENIVNLAEAMLSGVYEPSGSVSFIIYDPMVREIFAAPFIDRIVHHFLYTLQAGWWDRRFIHDSYSCRDGKGTKLGAERIQRMMRSATEGGTKEAYIAKMDVKGYFMSLPRFRLYKRVLWGLRRQFAKDIHDPNVRWLYDLCKCLWQQVLMDDPVKKSYRRGNKKQWADLPPEKSLYDRDPGYGIVIGNLTSQLVSNIYLDLLDRYVKDNLKYKYYGRYVDDFIIIVRADEYEKLLADIKKIENFLKTELGLTLHKRKRYIQPVRRGVNFLGARVYLNCMYPSNRLQSKFKREIHKFLKYDGANADSLASYLGLMKYMNADKFVKGVFDKYGLDYNLYLESKRDRRRGFNEILEDLLVTAKITP